MWRVRRVSALRQKRPFPERILTDAVEKGLEEPGEQ
jgi:hypothetical protein